MDKYIEYKFFPDEEYGFSVEDYRKDVGGDGITIESFDFIEGKKENILYVCMSKEEAIEIANAILELCD